MSMDRNRNIASTPAEATRDHAEAGSPSLAEEMKDLASGSVTVDHARLRAMKQEWACAMKERSRGRRSTGPFAIRSR